MRLHFKTRPLEWIVICQTFTFGLWIALPFQSMGGSGYAAILQWAPEIVWGGAFMSASAASAVAVYINGRRWWTPFARAVFAALLTACFAILALGFASVIPGSTAVYTYSVPMGGASTAVLYYAVKDCVHNWEAWRGVHG